MTDDIIRIRENVDTVQAFTAHCTCRVRCERCKTPWALSDSQNVHLVFYLGKKTEYVCDACYKNLSDQDQGDRSENGTP